MITLDNLETRFFTPREAVRMGFKPKDHVLVITNLGLGDEILGMATMKLSLAFDKIVRTKIVNFSLEGTLLEIDRKNGFKASLKDYLIYAKNIVTRKTPRVPSFKLN